MERTFIQRVLDALYKERTIFSRKKKDTAISETIERVTTGDKAEASNKKAIKANARSKADVKEKPKGETEAESEERIRSCALEIKSCIDLINSSGGGTPGKSKRRRKRTKVDKRKAKKGADNRKTSIRRNSNKGTKGSQQDISPAEMVMLVAKAEEKVSEAVVKAKEKDNKKKKERKKK